MKNLSHRLFAGCVCMAGIFLFTTLQAQEDKKSRPSPPAEASAKVGNTTITINYSQPSVKGRKVWGDLVPFGQVWRAGANEATTFQVDKDVKIESQSLPAGKYGFFAIAGPEEWTLIFNKVADQWGAFEYSDKQDALRVKVRSQKSSAFNEKLTYQVDKSGKVSLLWENVVVSFNVK